MASGFNTEYEKAETVNSDMKKWIQAAVGGATLIILYLLFRRTGVFAYEMAPVNADGTVGALPTTTAMIVDILVSSLAAIGAYVITGAIAGGKWLMSLLNRGNQPPAPQIRNAQSAPSQPAAGVYADAMRLPPPPMPLQQQQLLQHAVNMAIAEEDFDTLKLAVQALNSGKAVTA